MRRNELRTAKGYIEALMQNMDDCDHWRIEGIVTPKISVDQETATYEYLADEWEGDRRVKKLRQSHIFKQGSFTAAPFDHVFGWQETHYEDCYCGQMLFPLEGDKYLLVGWSM